MFHHCSIFKCQSVLQCLALLFFRENNIDPQVDSYTALMAGYAANGDLEGIDKVMSIFSFVSYICEYVWKYKKCICLYVFVCTSIHLQIYSFGHLQL